MEAERSQVTVLLTDMAGFTPIGRRRRDNADGRKRFD